MKKMELISKTEVGEESVTLFKAWSGKKWSYIVGTTTAACEHDNLLDAIECYKDKIDWLLK